MMSDHATQYKARKLTATAIARTNPPSRGQRDIPDTDPRGFGLAVPAEGNGEPFGASIVLGEPETARPAYGVGHR